MRDPMQPDCPRTEQLSAWIDGELPSAARNEIAVHAETCALCGAMLADLNELRTALRPLADARPGIDLAPSIGERIAGRSPAERTPRALTRPARASSWWSGWQVVPSGLAAAATLATGLYLGLLLAGGAGMATLQPAAMAVFDPVPPGGICVGLSSCYPLGN